MMPDVAFLDLFDDSVEMLFRVDGENQMTGGGKIFFVYFWFIKVTCTRKITPKG